MNESNPAPHQGEPCDPSLQAAWQAIKYALCLSETQLQVVQCLYLGLAMDHIASELSLCPSVVHSELDRIYRKTHVTNRMELSTWISQAFVALPAMALLN